MRSFFAIWYCWHSWYGSIWYNEQKGLVPTLTELLHDTKEDPFVLRAARTLIERVSDQEGVTAASGAFEGYDSLMNVA